MILVLRGFLELERGVLHCCNLSPAEKLHKENGDALSECTKILRNTRIKMLFTISEPSRGLVVGRSELPRFRNGRHPFLPLHGTGGNSALKGGFSREVT